jgi:tetratricopeptide (TPR) repeat protein
MTTLMRLAGLTLLITLQAVAALGAPRTDGEADRQITTYELREWSYWNDMGYMSLQEGDYVRAAGRFQRAIEFARPSSKHDPRLLARSYGDLAMALLQQGRAAEAAPLAEWALIVREAYTPQGSEAVAQSRYNLAMIEIALERMDDAEGHMKGCIASYEKVLGARSGRLVPYLNDLAYFYMTRKKLDKAEALYRRCIDLPEESLALDSPDRARSLFGLGNIRAIRGMDDEAEPLFRKALAALESETNFPPTSRLTLPPTGRAAQRARVSPARMTLQADVLDNLAALLRRTERVPEAEKIEAQSKELQAKVAALAAPAPKPPPSRR